MDQNQKGEISPQKFLLPSADAKVGCRHLFWDGQSLSKALSHCTGYEIKDIH